ncbi:MAG: glycosyltransferase family 8 protein [Candidatus Peregrinibacteria bacterium]
MAAPTAHIVFAANENHAIGLAVTVRSLLEHWNPSQPLTLRILDAGLHPETVKQLMASWKFPSVSIAFQPVDLHPVAHLKLTRGMQAVTYSRLLLPGIFPDVHRTLYLDSDLLIRTDVTPLWETDLGGKPMGAVQDTGCPVVSSPSIGLHNYRELGLDPGLPYCNAGVLLLDLERWRKDAISERIIRYVVTHPHDIQWWDQDGLNAVLAGQWQLLDRRWNVTAQAIELMGWHPPAHEHAHIQCLNEEAKIIHFLGRYKPWKEGSRHPKTAEFFDVLNRTAWAGWQPDPTSAIPPIKKHEG